MSKRPHSVDGNSPVMLDEVPIKSPKSATEFLFPNTPDDGFGGLEELSDEDLPVSGSSLHNLCELTQSGRISSQGSSSVQLLLSRSENISNRSDTKVKSFDSSPKQLVLM